jgi:glycosyltransferase involved in cell wall biosynthesis
VPAPRAPDVAIIVPAYNEAPVIASVLGELLERYEHVVCVDDGSTDETAAQVRPTSAVLVRHPINLGQGAALQTGIEYALQDPSIAYFVTYDADGQHRIEDVEALLAVVRSGEVDIALGSRFLRPGTSMTATRRFVLRLAVVFTRITAGMDVTDAHNGLRAFNRRVAETLDIELSDMSHASEVIVKIKQHGYRWREVPVVVNYTEYSMRKGQSAWNAINIAFDLFLTPRSRK